MMNTIHFDTQVSDDSRREQLFDGQLFVYSPTSGSLKLIEFARELISEAFGSLDPLTAQHQMPVEKYAALLAELKPKFIHHPESKKFIPQILEDLGCDLGKTYFDVPRMRTATSDDYLTTGIAYAFHPHRDTWYSAPPCQVNFWIPIYEIESGRSMAFHPHYWSHPVRNSSENYNYGEWNKTSRANAAQHIKTDTRVQPKALEPVELEPQVRVITKVGGILVFSGAHLHSTVPNFSGKTRFSIDFRTVHIDDVATFRGAHNVDSSCTGTCMNDYLRGTDLAHVPQDLVAAYEPGPRVLAGRLTHPQSA
jgi:hypothetical protein